MIVGDVNVCSGVLFIIVGKQECATPPSTLARWYSSQWIEVSSSHEYQVARKRQGARIKKK